MKLLIIGATGTVGSAAVEAALRAGHDVTVLARSPEKLGEAAGRVRVLTGDLLDERAVARAVEGQQAVISALGSSPEADQLDIPASITRKVSGAMAVAGVRRLVCMSGGAVEVPGERKPLSGRLTSALVRLLARNVVEAKQREFQVVAASGGDWTVVRPPNVVPGPPTGKVEISGRLHGFRINSGDVAEAMVRLAGGSDWLRQAPYVSTGR